MSTRLPLSSHTDELLGAVTVGGDGAQLWLAGVAGAVASPVILLVLAWLLRKWIMWRAATAIDRRRESRARSREDFSVETPPHGNRPGTWGGGAV